MNERIWLDSYPEGVAHDLGELRYANLGEMLAQRVLASPEAAAFSNQGTTLSYAQLDEQSRHFAAYLSNRLGLRPGDRVAVMLPNLLQSPIVLMAILRAGLVLVNVNPQYTPRELKHQLTDSGAKAIVVLENLAGILSKAREGTPVKHVITTAIADGHKGLKRHLVSFVVRYVRKMVPEVEIADARKYLDVMEQGKALNYADPAVGLDDIACLQYTGGTTGVAKGAVLTHRNVVSNVMQVTEWARPFFNPNDGVVVTPLPIYHIFALTVNVFCFLELGGHNLLITDPRDIGTLVATLKKNRFAFISGVNTLFNALMQDREFAALDFSALRITLAGGMAVQRDVAERWQRLTGCVIAQGYGLTESSPVVSANRIDQEQFNGSVGLPMPSTDVQIRGDDGTALPPGESGEIAVRGPQVMQGYWQRPDETAKVLTPDGWLLTGDVGRLDPQGYLYVEDRIKDMIIVSGFKVFPNEIEDVVTSHPGVHEAAAIGVPDPESGERVKLIVVKSDDSLTGDAIKAFCRERLTGYKRPTAIEFRNSLPKSNVGKILRRELRDQ